MVDSGSWGDIVCTTVTYSEIPSSAGTWQYRAQVKSGVCSEAFSESLTIIVSSKAAATVTLGALAQTYNGAGRTATATTTPSGLTVTFTYDGSSTLPVNAGTYVVVATIDDESYYGSASADMVIAKAVATVTLSGLTATYDGTQKSPVATTTPAGLTTYLSYTGPAKYRSYPINAGSYLFTATISDKNYQGSTTGTLVISKATATITTGGLSATYDGNTHGVTTTTSPAGLTVGVTYNGSSVVPADAGTYSVVCTIVSDNYQGSSTANLVIAKAEAAISILSSLLADYDGNAHPATATASISGVTVVFTYNGSSAVPVTAGTYTVVAVISNGNYQGTATYTLVISKSVQSIITFDNIPEGLRVTEQYQLVASATSGLPVIFESSDPSIVSISGNTMTVKGDGTVTITAKQAGDNNYNSAADVTQSVITLPTFDNINSLFSPNGDGMNDSWHIPDMESYGVLQVIVYNRYGQEIYQSDSYKNDWDGTWNGYPLPSASYYYLINSSAKGMLKGVVNIVR
jgi:gliding motility-associated-like protein